ncbi:hypothetical protein QWI17_15260 [Gilvimarinus sp. SDUM040013]|uniref:Uncharacterized protein n=1 Tax=Gilvimarinus gilvus TaxID=3058038 RepID=A0ABU4S4H6_9GAMM|nr:hypothetical protein [Gilvimarinus sp. SDUM040013]MDO3387200.1 hypothetical protein [Gilvimarinus sp. SDUM040013]MDX6850763.1 hypothetical protein [Gilvimarinus sp. SDUM040013]
MPFDIRCVVLPYCLELQECGRYAVLNRNYKPLGFIVDDFVNYQQYPVLLTVRITPRLARTISHKASADTSKIYLYDDGCLPTASAKAWASYCARLNKLIGLNVSGPEQREHNMDGRNVRRLNLIQPVK